MIFDPVKYKAGLILRGLIDETFTTGSKEIRPGDNDSVRYVGWLKAATRLIEGIDRFFVYGFDTIAERDSFFDANKEALYSFQTFAIVRNDSAIFAWTGDTNPAMYISSSWINMMPPGSGIATHDEIQDLIRDIELEIITTDTPSTKQLKGTRWLSTRAPAIIDISRFYSPPSVHNISIDDISTCYLESLDQVSGANHILCYELHQSRLLQSASVTVTEWINGDSSRNYTLMLSLPTVNEFQLAFLRSLSFALVDIPAADVETVAGRNGLSIVFTMVDVYGDTYTSTRLLSVRRARDDEKVYLFYSSDKAFVTATLDREQVRGRPFVQDTYSGYSYFNILVNGSYPDLEHIIIGDHDLCGSFIKRDDKVIVAGNSYNVFQSCVPIEAVIDRETIIR